MDSADKEIPVVIVTITPTERPLVLKRRGKTQALKEAQRRYEQTDKGKERRRRYNESHAEAVRAWKREWDRQNRPARDRKVVLSDEAKARKRERDRLYAEKNKEAIAARKREWAAKRRAEKRAQNPPEE